jgi:predicted MFS family arabinose efflux permease
MESDLLNVDNLKLPRSTRSEVFLFTLIRTVINSGYRLVYPFLPLFAAGMGVSLTQMGLAFSIRSVLGAVSPFVASIADTHGRKKGMLLGLFLFWIGCLASVLKPDFIGFIIGSALLVVGNGVFIPSMQSYLGDRVPYESRGRVLAITELSWALGFILGVPLLGFLLKTYNWWTPSIALSIVGFILLICLWYFIPSDSPTQAKGQSLLSNFKLILHFSPVLVGLLTAFLFTVSNEVVNLVFGQWIRDNFGLAFETLTLASVIIGTSELASEFLSAVFLDKLGKIRTIFASLVVNTIAVVLLAMSGNSFALALLGLALFYISFEFALIAMMTYMSEIFPAARATVLAVTVAMFSMGRLGGSLVGPGLYQSGFWFTCLTSVILNVAAFLIFYFFLKRSKLSLAV